MCRCPSATIHTQSTPSPHPIHTHVLAHETWVSSARQPLAPMHTPVRSASPPPPLLTHTHPRRTCVTWISFSRSTFLWYSLRMILQDTWGGAFTCEYSSFLRFFCAKRGTWPVASHGSRNLNVHTTSLPHASDAHTPDHTCVIWPASSRGSLHTVLHVFDVQT